MADPHRYIQRHAQRQHRVFGARMVGGFLLAGGFHIAIVIGLRGASSLQAMRQWRIGHVLTYQLFHVHSFSLGYFKNQFIVNLQQYARA